MMAAVYVYAPGADDFSTLGLCGPLTPTKCEFTERRNGMSQLNLDHPIDDYGRWSQLVPGCVLKAEVPVRTTPEIDGTALVTTVETWKVKTTATSGQRKLYSKPSGGRVLKTLPIWADKAKTQRFEVTVVRKLDRYKAKTKYGTGWINPAALEYSVTNTIGSDPAAIEAVESAWTTKPQLFRIREAVVSETGVSVTASHIFYDLSSNITTWSGYDSASGTNNPTCAAALAGILSGCAASHEFEGYTNLLDRRVAVAWTRTAAVEALLAAETGLVDRWGAELVRDNYEFYVLREAGQNRGVRIEYGKNLLGVECTTDVGDVIARILPVGQTSKGKDLFLTPGTYTVNGTAVTIGAGETWVTSPQAGDYPAPMLSVLDTGVKAKSGSSGDVAAARLKMIEAALNKFADDKCDQPSVNVKVTYINLGDTVEYEQYKRLDDLYLCDRVRVRHPGIRVDVLTEVIEVVWDCLTGRMKSTELGRVQLDRARVKLPVWQLPSGIPGALLAPRTLSSYALDDSVGNDIDVTNNESVAAVAQQYVRNAWITGGQVFRYASGSPAPDPASIVVTANLQNVLMDRWQYQDSNGAWQDYPIGDGNDTINATTLVVKPGHAVWVNNVCTLRMLTTDAAISDTYNLYRVYDGATGATGATGAQGIAGIDGLTAILSNAAHTLPKATDGTIIYTGSGTTLRLFEGAAELTYDGVGANNGAWKVTITAVNITCGSLTDSGNYLTVGAHSAMTGSTASVTYAITGKRANGAAISLSITQTLSIAQQGVTGATGPAGADAAIVSPTLSANPTTGQLIAYTGVEPNELLRWTGTGINPTQRRYAASKSGAAVPVEDLSDNHTLGVTVRTVASQASGTPSPTAPLAISGKSSVMVLRRGKNLFNSALNGATLNGVTIRYDPATQEIMLNGTCMADNTVFYFLNAPQQMNAAHIYSTRYVSGSFSPVGFNSIQMFHTQGQSGCYIPTAADPLRIALIDGARSYTSMNIRIDAGSVFTNFKFKTQIELGATATEWEPYVAQAYTLIPDAPTYGLSEAQDHIGTDGLVAHYTMLLTLTGNEAFNDGSDLGSVVRVGLPGIIAGTPGDTPSICSHFQHLYSYASDTVHYYVTGDALILYIPKSLLSSYDLAGAKAWIKAQATAGTPIQVLYQRANPVYAAVAPVAITGMDGTNTVTSDGASVTVSYTGSGWAAAGAVQRVAVESVSITPEQGLRVDTVLTSADGSQQVPTYFNARGTKYGLFRTSDGMMILGGMVLPNGQPAGIAGALVSPGATGETRIEIETASQGSGQARIDTAALHLVQPSFAGATDINPAPTGEKVPVWFEAVRTTLLNGDQTYADSYRTAIKALGSMQLIALGGGGEALAWLLVEHTPEGGLIHTDGAYSASDSERTLANFTPRIQMSAPTGESIVYNATARRYMLDWKAIDNGYGRFQTFKGGNQSLRDVGIVIRQPGAYRFVFHADFESSGSSGAVLHVNRMPFDWSPPANRDYCLDSDLTARIAYRRAASAPLNASVTTCMLVADLWCEDGDKVLPVVAMAAASKTLVSAGTFFTAQKVG